MAAAHCVCAGAGLLVGTHPGHHSAVVFQQLVFDLPHPRLVDQVVQPLVHRAGVVQRHAQQLHRGTRSYGDCHRAGHTGRRGLEPHRVPLQGPAHGLLIAPMVVPVIVIGVATYLYFAPLGLSDSYVGLIAVHAAMGAPFVLTTVLATLANFNHNLVRASLSLGETPFNTFMRVTLPVIAPGVISGALFAFATSFDEVVVTLFLAGAEQTTLPRQMFTGIRENISPTIAAVATLLILFTTAMLLVLEWLRGRKA